ncbi:hypothetical protein [Hoeflea ulvae]|uniref:Uncharacterized protein n=1 Tax=Hoeflea ulvae TaxID=2983764 RepID=A0ABT3YII9_9HYPH|nr:hypothetical protein [Hoeflea ulvae]MCY0095711.1 hypothetical protein [Hoeflea ulvae]
MRHHHIEMRVDAVLEHGDLVIGAATRLALHQIMHAALDIGFHRRVLK